MAGKITAGVRWNVLPRFRFLTNSSGWKKLTVCSCICDQNQLHPQSATDVLCARGGFTVLADFPMDAERFRVAPPYNFREPPHEGSLYYEQFDWGVKGEQWRRFAAAALSELELCRTR